jgi:hypothetical protein
MTTTEKKTAIFNAFGRALDNDEASMLTFIITPKPESGGFIDEGMFYTPKSESVENIAVLTASVINSMENPVIAGIILAAAQEYLVANMPETQSTFATSRN